MYYDAGITHCNGRYMHLDGGVFDNSVHYENKHDVLLRDMDFEHLLNINGTLLGS